VAADKHSASFAVINQLDTDLVLKDFALSTAEFPERSSTLLIELPALSGGPNLEWRGPGIANAQRVSLQGLTADFWLQWQTNQALFPQGVDIIFTCGSSVLGLPRTTSVSQMEGV
jgi:alpha-D-ribose 1-methylphosphonate 5-triphosphate synthase subunit PhnH